MECEHSELLLNLCDKSLHTNYSFQRLIYGGSRRVGVYHKLIWSWTLTGLGLHVMVVPKLVPRLWATSFPKVWVYVGGGSGQEEISVWKISDSKWVPWNQIGDYSRTWVFWGFCWGKWSTRDHAWWLNWFPSGHLENECACRSREKTQTLRSCYIRQSDSVFHELLYLISTCWYMTGITTLLTCLEKWLCAYHPHSLASYHTQPPSAVQ